MTVGEMVRQFIETATDDPTIGPSHIALYLAILLAWELKGGRNPVEIYSRRLMRKAKLSATTTYYKCMRDLQAGGHIQYIPSYDPAIGSTVYLTGVKNEGYGGEVASGDGGRGDVGVIETADGR